MKAKVVNMSWHGGDLEIGRAAEGELPLKYWIILNKQTGHAHSTALIKSKSVAQITEVWRADRGIRVRVQILSWALADE